MVVVCRKCLRTLVWSHHCDSPHDVRFSLLHSLSARHRHSRRGPCASDRRQASRPSVAKVDGRPPHSLVLVSRIVSGPSDSLLLPEFSQWDFVAWRVPVAGHPRLCEIYKAPEAGGARYRGALDFDWELRKSTSTDRHLCSRYLA